MYEIISKSIYLFLSYEALCDFCQSRVIGLMLFNKLAIQNHSLISMHMQSSINTNFRVYEALMDQHTEGIPLHLAIYISVAGIKAIKPYTSTNFLSWKSHLLFRSAAYIQMQFRLLFIMGAKH